MFTFITKRSFIVNLLAAIVLGLLIIWTFLQLLGMFTKHGEYLTVPSVLGKPTHEAIKMLEEKGFEVTIQDSVFVDTAQRGIVLKQLPDPNSTVKINRTVYLTVNRKTLPLVDMPALEGKTLNYALEILKRSHLVLGDTTFKPDFMRGSVLEQSYKGMRITPGSKIPWGSPVDLLVGSGLTMEKIKVPDLLGLTFQEATVILEANGIELGAVITEPDVKDTAIAFIFKQSPMVKDEDDLPSYILPGQLMDVWLSVEKKVIKDTTTNLP
ncbi:MAG TPA: PASTA domain-containing protein [Ferruginibacter sp.]|nr:PASTA domain-containing protein [Ferruginibacter sp.]